jgi:hypothetical protein
MSGCAFCIIVDEQIVYSHVEQIKLHSSYNAEKRALHLLLQYIRDEIEPGSTVKENRNAHNLASKGYVSPLTLEPTTRKKQFEFIESKTMFVDDITIRDSMRETCPKEQKYQKRLAYYLKHGKPYRTIEVDANGLLLDGYISYLILREYGINECCVDVVQRKTVE